MALLHVVALLVTALIVLRQTPMLQGQKHPWKTWTLLCIGIVMTLRMTWWRTTGPYGAIPTVKFSTWRTSLRALLQLPASEDLLRTAREHPESPMIKYRGKLGTPTLVVIHEQARKEVYATQAYENFERPFGARNRLTTFSGTGLLTSEGDMHKAQRRWLSPAFSARHIRSLAPVVWAKSCEMARRLDAHIDHHSGANIEMYPWISRAALDIIGVASWGKDFEALANPDSDLVTTYRKMFGPVTLLASLISEFLPASLFLHLPVERIRTVRNGVKAMRLAAQRAIRDRKKSLESDSKDILSVAMRQGSVPEEHLIETLLTFVIAGHETSTSGASWACYHLARHPEVQHRLREEIRTNLPSPAHDIEVTADMLQSLPYLQAVTLESLRMNPPVPCPSRVARRDTVICGQPVTRGTYVQDHLWVSSQLYVSDPAFFNPDRWLDSAGQLRENGSTGDYQFSPFSFGVRACIGSHFARQEQLALLACLAGKFEMLLACDDKIDMNFEVVANPVNPIRLHLSPLPGW